MKTVVLTLIKSDNYDYYFKDEKNNHEYKLNIEFSKVNINLTPKDSIVLSYELLDKKYEEYSTSYTFGELEDVTGREIKKENQKDIILIIENNKKHYLKRLYG